MKFWPFSRKKAKSRRSFAGAEISRLLSDWVAQGTSADSELRGSLKQLRYRARQLARDNDYMKNFLREVRINVVGQGIPFQGQVMKQRGKTLDESINTQIESAWARWCRKEFCHTGGTLCFDDIERLLISAIASDGEVYVRKIFRPFGGSKIPFALELLEADMIDDDENGVGPTGNEIRMGVEKDDWGRPVAYYVKTRHPGDYNMISVGKGNAYTKIRVPANEIIPLYVSERISQTRGIPWIASALKRLHHLNGYEEAEVIAARAGASLMGFIESDSGQLQGDDVVGTERVSDFQPGVFKYLAPGEKVNVPDLNRPSGQFDPFTRAMIRGVAAGVGVSYESISKDYSQSNYSSSRQALLSDRDNWRVLQKWMIQNFHQPVFEAWLDMAVLSGVLSLRDYEINPERYQSVRWMPRGWSWIDPQKEVSAYKEAIRGGLTTLSKVVAQDGDDIEDLMAQREREVKRAAELGLVFDTDAKVSKYTGGNSGAPQDTPPPQNAE